MWGPGGADQTRPEGDAAGGLRMMPPGPALCRGSLCQDTVLLAPTHSALLPLCDAAVAECPLDHAELGQGGSLMKPCILLPGPHRTGHPQPPTVQEVLEAQVGLIHPVPPPTDPPTWGLRKGP